MSVEEATIKGSGSGVLRVVDRAVREAIWTREYSGPESEIPSMPKDWMPEDYNLRSTFGLHLGLDEIDIADIYDSIESKLNIDLFSYNKDPYSLSIWQLVKDMKGIVREKENASR
jgi:hypothetical protein